MTSRQYSLFSLSSARAKARREKFAQTRKSLSATWGSDSAGCILELPSPTIGTPPKHLYLLPHAISPLAIFTTRTGTATAVHSSSGEDLLEGGGGPSCSSAEGGRCCSAAGGSGPLRRKPTMMPPPVLAGGVRRKHRPCFRRDAPRLAPTKEQPAHLEASASTPINPFLSSSLSEDGFPGLRERSKSFSDFSKSWEPFIPLGQNSKTSSPLPAKRTTQPPSRLDLFQMRNSLDHQNWICEKCEADATCVLVAQKKQQQSKILPAKSKILKGPATTVFGDASPPFFRKANTLPEQEKDSRILVAMRNADKRREFFARKHTNSAPDRYTGFSETATSSSTPMAGTTTMTGWNENSLAENILDTTRRICGNCREPITKCLDGVLRVTRKGDTSTITPPSVEVWESEIRTARCGDVAVTHVSELDYPDADPPCHFCCEQASTAIHDESRLQIVSGGLVRSRDGSTRSGSAPYINLPSPNVQTEGAQPPFGSLELSPSMSQNLLLSPGSHHHHMLAGASGLPCPHRLSGVSAASSLGGGGIGAAGTSCGGNTVPSSRGGSIVSSSCVEELPLVGPPASALTRRPALVPPKLIPDHDYDGDGDGKDGKSWGRCSSDDLSTSPRNRRSSIVVIPPMQICPGDLLVYGKVLSQRKSLLGTPIESPSPIPTIFDSDSNQSRKGKVTWSLLKLFERSSRSKGGPSGTLEEIMNLIQPCDFSDPKLSRFKGMVWSDFVAHVCNQKTKKSGSVVSSGSSSGPSTSSSVNDFKYGAAGPSSAVAGPSTSSSTSPPTALKVSMTTSGAMATVMSSPTKTVNPAPSKPLVRKRMGLMRTMSDRCLERRITPALFRAQGFLMSEKLVEGKEPESGGPSGACGGGESSPPPVPAIPDPAATATNLAAAGPSTSRKSSSDETDPEQRQKLRQKEALWDLFQSECSFLYDHLMVLKNVFMEPLKRIQVEGFAMYAEPELLFGNLDELCAVTYAFCKEFIHLLLTLTDLAGSLPTMQVLAKLFEPSSKARAMSQAYHRYALNYINALNYLETLRRHVEFCDFEKLCMKDPRCKKLQLTDLLVSPVQHLMKVPLILKDIQGRTAEPQEKALIVQILEIQENSIRELDDKMRWLKNFERLLEIQRNIVWPSILEMEPKTWVPDFLRVALGRQPCDSIIVSPRRQIIYEGLLQLWDTGKSSECYVILFDDMLLITRRKKGLSKKKSSLTENWQSACGKSGPVVGGEGSGPNHRYIVYRQPISLDRFFIHDIADGETNSTKLDSSFVLVSLNRFQQIIAVHTFQAPSDQIKNTWLIKLKSTQDKWKRTLQTTVFRGVRSSTDSGQSNVASSILGLAHNKSFLHRHNTCESSN